MYRKPGYDEAQEENLVGDKGKKGKGKGKKKDRKDEKEDKDGLSRRVTR